MGRPDPNQEALARLLGEEAPTTGQERVDGPSLELVIAMREAQSIGQVCAGGQFFGAQYSPVGVGDFELGGDG
jgi:hypothetical protein